MAKKTTKKEFEILGSLLSNLYALNLADSPIERFDDSERVKQCKAMDSRQAGPGFCDLADAFRTIARIAGISEFTLNNIFDSFDPSVKANITALKELEAENTKNKNEEIKNEIVGYLLENWDGIKKLDAIKAVKKMYPAVELGVISRAYNEAYEF